MGIGIGAPNANFNKGTIELAPNLNWKGIVPLVAMVERQTGVKARVTNDANAAALGEMIFGAAKGVKNFIILTLGTGLGSGIVIDRLAGLLFVPYAAWVTYATVLNASLLLLNET